MSQHRGLQGSCRPGRVKAQGPARPHKAAVFYVRRSFASTRPVVVAPYRVRQDGILAPELPHDCPDRPAGGEACSVHVNHWRVRKTGPEHPVLVAGCAVHGRAFTIYPPGHVPHGRRALAPVRPDGVEPAPTARCWAGTLFEAAANGAHGRPWAREAPGGSPRWWSTQGRLLDLALVLTGTHPDLDQELRHRIAEVLQVPALVLLEGTGEIREQPGYRSRGKAVMAVLRRVGRGLLRRLLAVGLLLGRWGRPLQFVAGTLRPLTSFPASGTDPPEP